MTIYIVIALFQVKPSMSPSLCILAVFSDKYVAEEYERKVLWDDRVLDTHIEEHRVDHPLIVVGGK